MLHQSRHRLYLKEKTKLPTCQSNKAVKLSTKGNFGICFAGGIKQEPGWDGFTIEQTAFVQGVGLDDLWGPFLSCGTMSDLIF